MAGKKDQEKAENIKILQQNIELAPTASQRVKNQIAKIEEQKMDQMEMDD
jgi:large subunit ribosomal protein L24e